MTYEKLFYLKFEKGFSTYDLARLFPSQIGRVSEIALLDIPEKTLRKVVGHEKVFNRLMRLKKKFSGFF